MPTELSHFILLIAQDKLNICSHVINTGIKFKKMFLVHSWRSAKEILKNENIDVIVIDLDLPDTNANEIIDNLEKIDIIKIVVLSDNRVYPEKLKKVVDDFIFYGDCNEISIRKSIMNINQLRRAKVLKNRIKQNLEMVPNKI